jgi:hypothetical protein
VAEAVDDRRDDVPENVRVGVRGPRRPFSFAFAFFI